MSLNAILLILGDEHVHPVAAIWSVASSEGVATRDAPQRCVSRDSAFELARQITQTSAVTRDYPWIRDANGSILSPAYQRGRAKTKRS